MRGHTHNAVDIDIIAHNSGLSNINPCFKCFFAVTALLLSITLGNMYIYIFTFAVMSLLTVAAGKIHLHCYIWLLCLPLVFIILSTLTLVFDINNGIRFSQLGAVEALYAFAAAMSGISCMYALALSTPISDIIYVLEKIKLPAILIELMYMIYRFIFVISAISYDMIAAARARRGFKNFRCSIETFAHIAKNLLICSLKKSNDFYNSLTARGYKGRLAFYCSFNRVKPMECVVFVLYILMVGVLCFL